MVQVAFLGLGVMGYPMAGHLVKAGFTVMIPMSRTSTISSTPASVAA